MQIGVVAAMHFLDVLVPLACFLLLIAVDGLHFHGLAVVVAAFVTTCVLLLVVVLLLDVWLLRLESLGGRGCRNRALCRSCVCVRR